MYLFFDTETTGVHATAEIVQFAAMLYDHNKRPIGQFKTLINHENLVIPQGAKDVHGIEEADCEKYGLNAGVVIKLFDIWCERSDFLIAHNINFDIGKLNNMASVCGLPEMKYPENKFCTMQATTDICKIPSHRGYKWPKLTEAYHHIFQEDFDDAHDAMADVKACAKVYFWLLEQQAQQKVA